MLKHILVVEDEPGIQELLRINLSMAGYQVTQAFNAAEALVFLHSSLPDLMLVDWNMPGRSGISLVSAVRADVRLGTVPMIMLSARGEELDKVLALDAGVDDYVTKPFKPRELRARVHSLLRRAGGAFEPGVIEIDGLRLNHADRRVLIGSREITVSSVEYKLLHFLVLHPMRVHSREQLLDHVWQNGEELQARTVDAYVARLRSTLLAAGHPPCIETVRAMGYRFVRQPVSKVPGGRQREQSLHG